jgi:thioredoxin-like negative regulator of GroEL
LGAVLRLNPADELAAHTRLQLLITLDQFPGALSSIKSTSKDESTLEQAYCLYKTGREKDALALLGELPVEVTESRAAKLLEAQIVSKHHLIQLLVTI